VGGALPAHGWRQRSTRDTLVPMGAQMGETAVTPTLPEAGPEPEFRATARERLGIAAFVLVAVVATTTWIALLVWGVLLLAKSL